MRTWYKWFSFGITPPITDKVLIGATLLVNRCNVYIDDRHDQYFQQAIDELELTLEQCADILELVYMSTMGIYCKRDFHERLPLYTAALRIPSNASVHVDNSGRCSIMVRVTSKQMEVSCGSTV